MSEFFLPVLLQLAGMALIFTEIFLPSGGLLSIMAIALFGYSLFIAFNISVSAGIAFVVFDIIMIPILVLLGLKMLARSPVTLHTELGSKEGVISQPPGLAKYIDKEGKALTDLRPAGTAIIDGKRVDVVSRGEYIEQDSTLVVIVVTGNQIVVRKK